MNSQYFAYGEKEIAYLKKKDKKLGALIDEFGYLERTVTTDLFAALVESVVGQQISDKAAASIYKRLTEMTEISAESIEAAPIAELRKCGLSERKAEYIKNIAKAVISGELNYNEMKEKSDAEIIDKLITIKGVGVWTAEMMLIFSFHRADILSFGDLGIRRNMMSLYGLSELPKEKFARYAKRYSPYGTIAAFYLWSMTDER
jgi:3-methyladenine DNA glycosylase/8-oxoguanine DNA glycosylase